MSADAITRLNAALEGRYRIERELGEGGMATVYLAKDLKHERNVALKVLQPELAAVVGAERFLAEIRTTANLQHPHILPLHDSGQADGLLFYVMPYVEGESLREKLDRERQLPVEDAVRIGVDLSEALDYAHRRGVVHRDIKPANILLHEGRPVIADFGIALAVSAGGASRLTETGLSLGTPHYMSPEQATGDQAVGPTADVYALGCVLYETLVGEPPFTGSTPQAILGKVITGDTPSASEERGAVPANVDGAIARALEKIPADRFQTGAELGEALKDPAFRHGIRETATARSPLRWIPTAIVVAGALFLGWFLGRSSEAADRAAPRVSSILLPRQDLLERGGWGLQPIAADADRMVYRVAERFEGLDPQAFAVTSVGELWSRRFSDGESTLLAGTRGAHGAFMSPDGQRVGYYDELTGELKTIPASGGAGATVVTIHETPFLGAAWGTDTIVYALPSGVWAVPENGGRPSQRTVTDPAQPVRHRQPLVPPGGGGLFFTVTDPDPEVPRDRIASLDPEGGIRYLTEGHSPRITEDGRLVFSRGSDRGSLWIADLSGGAEAVAAEPTRVLGNVHVSLVGGFLAAAYTVTSDGTLLYAPGDVDNAVHLYRAGDDGRFFPLIERSNPQLPPDTRSLQRPRLSPDGARLAFIADPFQVGQLFVLDLQRGVVNGVRPDLALDAPVWSRDGTRIIAARVSEEGWSLVRLRADGTGEVEQLLRQGADRVSPYAMSPDGRSLVYAVWPQEGPESGDLWVLPLAGGEPRPVLSTPASETQPELSPDGRWMAYVSEAAGGSDVYVTEFPESRTRTLISSGATGAAFAPVWRGDRIYFLTERGMVSVDVTAGSTFEARAPQVLFDARVYPCCGSGRPHDVSPDGSWFIWIYPTVEGISRIEMVQGWLGGVGSR